ncbi:zinc-ribbon domain-containing protein [Pectobacterium versatile]|uniref:Zinc-ribbon domain-containing protein n=1 Tax=Pectobacterium versatile TaxID=2488639 RepID=A0ABU8JTW6_9GAMM|nr:zinc-ribbon domain-containing protein [Pectobacterium versatile]
MNFAHLDPEVKAEAQHSKLRNMLNRLDATVMTQSWYCVWCGDHYQGIKRCYGSCNLRNYPCTRRKPHQFDVKTALPPREPVAVVRKIMMNK